MRSIDYGTDGSPVAAGGEISKPAEHHGLTPSGEVVAKFAPKRCTVRMTAKDLARTASGERKCDCAKKQAEAAAAAERAAASEKADLKSVAKDTSRPAAHGCPRCERLAALADAALSGEVCALTMPAEEVGPTQRSQFAHPVDADASAVSWLDGLQWAGLTLAGAGLLVAANRYEKRRAQQEVDDFSSAVDWLLRNAASTAVRPLDS